MRTPETSVRVPCAGSVLAVTLKAGPHTQPGTVVTTGIYNFGGETYAVTGGTGAYENVRGYATMVVVDDREVLTPNLIP